MLLLSRRLEEKILIGDDIEIAVLGIRENTVKIGITAPKELLILRSELKEAEDENKLAAEKTSQELVEELAQSIHTQKKGDETDE